MYLKHSIYLFVYVWVVHDCFKILTNVLPTSLRALITKFVIIILEGPPVFVVTIDMGTTAAYVSNKTLGYKGLFGTCIFLVYKFLSCGKMSRVIFRDIVGR